MSACFECEGEGMVPTQCTIHLLTCVVPLHGSSAKSPIYSHVLGYNNKAICNTNPFNTAVIC